MSNFPEITMDSVGKPQQPNFDYIHTPYDKSAPFNPNTDYSKIKSIHPDVSKKLWEAVDKQALHEFRFFTHCVQKKWEVVYGCYPPDSYNVDLDKYPGLHPDVTFFGFWATADQRIAYMCENIMTNTEIPLIDKLGNALASHFYGDARVHWAMTGEEDPKKALVNYTKLAEEQLQFKETGKIGEYTLHMREYLEARRKQGVKFWSTSELHTSLQTAARRFVNEWYLGDRMSEVKGTTNSVNEWIASWKNSGLLDKMINAGNMHNMAKILGEEWGIGAYYQFHGGGDASLLPELAGFIDERFVIPGPGAVWTSNLLFPNLSNKEVSHEDRIIWVRENQKELIGLPLIHEYFHNVEKNGIKIFKEDINEIKTYQAEVHFCQYGIYCQLKDNPKKIEARKSNHGINWESSDISCAIDSQNKNEDW